MDQRAKKPQDDRDKVKQRQETLHFYDIAPGVGISRQFYLLEGGDSIFFVPEAVK